MYRGTASRSANLAWFGEHSTRDAELTKCAAAFGAPVNFLKVGAWDLRDTGTQVCSNDVKDGACDKVIDWQCKVLDCTATVEPSRLVLCKGGSPGPSPPPGPPPAPSPPTGHGCLPGGSWSSMPFCDTTLTTAKRAADLVSRMALTDKCRMTGDGATVGGGGLPALGLQKYSWNTEALHGLAAACIIINGTTRCPTVFPAPPGMGSTFNLTLAHRMGVAIGDEARAMNNLHGCRARGGGGCGWGNGNWYIGLNVWVPNLNIYRDPRWGRNIEVPSEDPFHSGSYGAAVVAGVQWNVDGTRTGPTKINAALKHVFAYNAESGRGSTNFDISSHDIQDTYLPSFEAPVVESDAKGYMCAYSSVNGEPGCGSPFLKRTFREKWNFSGYVVSDCGGVSDITGYLKVNDTMAAAIALREGVDINCGGGLTNHICDAISEKLVNESVLDASLIRSYSLLFEAGMFDPLKGQKYTTLGIETVGSPAIRELALDAARQALVLLKTDGRTLPAKASGKIALIGPHAQTHLLLGGNYFENICPDSGNLCVPSMEDAIGNITAQASPTAGTLTVASGCDSTECGALSRKFVKALAAAAEADTVILALGLMGKPQIFDFKEKRKQEEVTATSARGAAPSSCANGGDGTEGEGHDRDCIGLPIGQLKLVDDVIAVLKPNVNVTIVLFNGGGLAIEGLMANPRVGAIVEAFYPGVSGAVGVAETLFGKSNRWSKLPYTLLARKFTEESTFQDLNMTDPPGRTYKYYTGPNTIRPFGFGLSYTTFELGPPSLELNLAGALGGADKDNNNVLLTGEMPTRTLGVLPGDADVIATTSIKVTNTGTLTGDEVVFLFHNGTASTQKWETRLATDGPDPLAIKLLVGFKRVRLEVGESTTVTFNVTLRSLSNVDKHGVRHVLSGPHELIFSRGVGEEKKVAVGLRGGANGGQERVVLSEL